MKQLTVIFLAGILVMPIAVTHAQTVKRNRDEGVMRIGASNVMGNGNITAYVLGSTAYSRSGFILSPCIGAQVGITDIMELSGQLVPVTSKGLGPIDVHLQITTPGNDKLRFLGLALRADLFLSTFQDTLSSTTAKEKPEYNSYPSATFIADLDWMAFRKWLPFKTYFKASLSDNPDLLFRYDQIALASALEWKMMQHALFACAGLGMYKEKQTKTRSGDATYSQKYVFVEPGGRFRLFSRFSILGSAKVTVYQDVKGKDPLRPELFNVSLKIEAPLFFRETNTEAIRTLLYQEQNKEKKNTATTENLKSDKMLLNSIASQDENGDSLTSFDYTLERAALLKRREETQKKMAEIEKVFMELDKEDSLKSVDKPGNYLDQNKKDSVTIR